MIPNKRNLKAFIRFDGSGRIVAGSLVLRKKMPKIGKWYEVPAYECCNSEGTVLEYLLMLLATQSGNQAEILRRLEGLLNP